MKRLTNKLFNEKNINSAIIFYSVVVLYTLIIDVIIDVKKYLSFSLLPFFFGY